MQTNSAFIKSTNPKPFDDGTKKGKAVKGKTRKQALVDAITESISDAIGDYDFQI